MADVDVIVPAYNPGSYLRRALDSVIAQSHTDWICVVIDDGSTEDLSWAGELDPQIRLLRQANQGLTGARNSGIAQGASPLVAFLDADDVWLPGKLEAQISAMRDEAVVLCSTAFIDMIDAEGLWLQGGFEHFASSHEELLQGNGICVSTAMTRRSRLDAVGGFSLRLAQAQDWDLWLRLTAGGGQAVKINQVLAHYRVHSSNMSRNYKRMLLESTTAIKMHSRVETRQYARAGLRRVRRVAGAPGVRHVPRDPSPHTSRPCPLLAPCIYNSGAGF